MMPLTDFLQRVKCNEETWDIIVKRANQKFSYDVKVTNMSKRMKFKGVKKKINYNLPAHDLVKPNAFAAMSFCGEPVPFNKVERVMGRLRRGADEILDHSEYLAQTEIGCLAQVT